MPQPRDPSRPFKRRATRTYDAANAADDTVQLIVELLCPAGTIIPTLAASEPGDGWKICNGQSLVKSGYPRLYAVIGGTFGEDATTFNLPDLTGTFPMGAGGAVSLMSLGGAADVTLSVGQLPPHGHSITDPGHSHSFTGSPHIHSITDPGHTHSSAQAVPNTAAAGVDVSAVTSGPTGSSATGVSVGSTTAGGTVGSASTGVSIGSTGDGDPIEILPPFIAVNWMVRT